MAASASSLAVGSRVTLRDRCLDDLPHFLRWQTQGQWLQFDAPWDRPRQPDLHEYRRRFLEKLAESPPDPRTDCVIALADDRPIGWMVRYAEARFPLVWWIGIDIGEDAYLNRGLGTEALRLWVDYLFGHSAVHKLCLDTWSLNTRMACVAERVGFRLEGVERELIHWQGRWLDRLRFGMLRSEWSSGPGT